MKLRVEGGVVTDQPRMELVVTPESVIWVEDWEKTEKEPE